MILIHLKLFYTTSSNNIRSCNTISHDILIFCKTNSVVPLDNIHIHEGKLILQASYSAPLCNIIHVFFINVWTSYLPELSSSLRTLLLSRCEWLINGKQSFQMIAGQLPLISYLCPVQKNDSWPAVCGLIPEVALNCAHNCT